MEQNTVIHKLDQKDFDLEIKPEWNNGKQLNIFCSFTYITPNYSVLFTLNELKKFVDQGNHKVFLVIWDMNTLANPYFKRMCSSSRITDPNLFINQKITELKDLIESLGFDREKISIYKSSELWKRFISYTDQNLFQEFYAVLAQMKIKDYVANDKVSHLAQIPMDLFFCNYFHKLFPEDSSRPIDLAFFGQDKENVYLATRDFMMKEGLVENKKPIFISIKDFPYLLHNHNVPEWNMVLKDIKNILINFPFTKKDIFSVFRHITNSINIRVREEDSFEELDYREFYNNYKDQTNEELIEILAENLHRYLKHHRKKYLETSGRIEESVMNVTNKDDVKNIGQVLKSELALEILLLSDGTRTISEISRELNKSVANISMYANKLRKMNLIRTLDNGKVKRNIKGVKVNFELGL